MSEQRLKESPEKAKLRIARRESRSAAVLHPILHLQQTLGNRRVAQLLQAKRLTPQGKIVGLQRKPTVGAANDHYEQEADHVAHRVLSMPDAVAVVAQRQMGKDDEKGESIQTKSTGSPADSFEAGAYVETQVSLSKGRGSPLPDPVRSYMEPRFGVDFSDVRVHTGSDAIHMNRDVGAQAFTHGSDIYYGAGHSPSNLDLTAHELTHVVQQTGGRRLRTERMNESVAPGPEPSVERSSEAHIQRRLIVSGATEALVNEYLTLVGTASGLRLNWAFGQPRVTIGGNRPGVVPSPDARSNIVRVINHATQHAELHIGTNQPRVSVGAFPAGASTIQTIDMDDIRNLNASLPGQGTAKAFHEMMENFNAHGIGFGAFNPSHAVGVEVESNVLDNQGIVGRRLGGGIPSTVIPAPAGQPTGPNITYLRQLQGFTHYFLEIIQRRTTGSPTGAGADFEVVSAQRIPKIQVSQRTIDSFTSGSNAIPPAGNVTLATALADLNGNPNSTILIEGFADSAGSRDANVVTSRNRAATAQAFFIANGIAADRIAIVGRGETNCVATNANEAGRLQNRRIQLTVHRPGP